MDSQAEAVFHPERPFFLRQAQQALRRLDMGADGRQRLVELMRQGRGHAAHGGQALRLELFDMFFDHAPFRKVAHEADEELLIVETRSGERDLDRKSRAVLAHAFQAPVAAVELDPGVGRRVSRRRLVRFR